MNNSANFKVIGVDIGNKYLRIAYPDRIQREFLFSDSNDAVIRELIFDPKADKNCYLGKNSDNPQVVVTGFRKFVMKEIKDYNNNDYQGTMFFMISLTIEHVTIDPKKPEFSFDIHYSTIFFFLFKYIYSKLKDAFGDERFLLFITVSPSMSKEKIDFINSCCRAFNESLVQQSLMNCPTNGKRLYLSAVFVYEPIAATHYYMNDVCNLYHTGNHEQDRFVIVCDFGHSAFRCTSVLIHNWDYVILSHNEFDSLSNQNNDDNNFVWSGKVSKILKPILEKLQDEIHKPVILVIGGISDSKKRLFKNLYRNLKVKFLDNQSQSVISFGASSVGCLFTTLSECSFFRQISKVKTSSLSDDIILTFETEEGIPCPPPIKFSRLTSLPIDESYTISHYKMLEMKLSDGSLLFKRSISNFDKLRIRIDDLENLFIYCLNNNIIVKCDVFHMKGQWHKHYRDIQKLAEEEEEMMKLCICKNSSMKILPQLFYTEPMETRKAKQEEVKRLIMACKTMKEFDDIRDQYKI